MAMPTADPFEQAPLPGGPLVVQTQGYTPHLWQDRSAIFFANVLALFFGNEEQTDVLRQEISQPESYGFRIIPVMGLLFQGQPNYLVLESRPDDSLCRYFATALGLRLPQWRMLSHADYVQLGQGTPEMLSASANELLAELAACKATVVDAFVTDPTVEGIAGRLGKPTVTTSEASRRGNNKYLLHCHLKAMEMPVFDTELAVDPADVPRCLAALKERGFVQAVLKAQIGASGVGLIKVGVDDGVAAPEMLFHEGPCMVQGWVRAGQDGVNEVFSPSVQMFLEDDSIYLYDLTEQILSHESTHEGNESPPPYLDDMPGLAQEIFRQAGIAGQWLHQEGYRGTASADFLVTRRQTGFEAIVCEVNARLTGATYPSLLARHFLPQGAWLMRNLKLARPVSGRAILRFLKQKGDLFEPNKKYGVVPLNFNTGPSGRVEKGQFLCLGANTAVCHEMLLRAERDLPIDWEYISD